MNCKELLVQIFSKMPHFQIEDVYDLVGCSWEQAETLLEMANHPERFSSHDLAYALGEFTNNETYKFMTLTNSDAMEAGKLLVSLHECEKNNEEFPETGPNPNPTTSDNETK